MGNKTKKLIINADDFGIDPATNRAVSELFTAGDITSTSLLVSAEATEEAVELIKAKGINFGIHLTLNSDFKEYPWRALNTMGISFTDGSGNLTPDLKKVADSAESREVTAECMAQISYAVNNGIQPDHLDNHSGTMYGINMRLFFINAFRLSHKYNLPFRFPKRGDFLKGYFKDKVPLYVKAAHKVITASAKVLGARLIDNMITNPYSIKDIDGYGALKDYYLNALNKVKPGVTEMFLHPSYYSDKLSPLTPEWKKREYELEFLNDPALYRRIEDEGIELVSYKDL